MRENELVYVLVAALVIWLIFGTHVDATVTVPVDEIRVRVPADAPGHYGNMDMAGEPYAPDVLGSGDWKVLDELNPAAHALGDLKQAGGVLPPLELGAEYYA